MLEPMPRKTFVYSHTPCNWTMCCQDAVGVLPGCCQDAAGVPGCCRGAAGVLPGCCRGAAGVLPGRCRGAAGVLPGCCRGAAGVLPLFQLPHVTCPCKGFQKLYRNSTWHRVPICTPTVPTVPRVMMFLGIQYSSVSSSHKCAINYK